MLYSYLSNKALFESIHEKYAKKLKAIEILEKKNKSKISIKMINKMMQEFNIMERVSPKPLQYCSIRPKYNKGVPYGSSKRSEVAYSTTLISLIKWLTNGKLEDTKLYTLIERVMKISDQTQADVKENRIASFKCLKDFLSILLNKMDTFNSKVVGDIISFMHFCMLAVKKFTNESEDNLYNKDAFLLLIFQILCPLDSLYKKIRNILIKDTKGLIELSMLQKRKIYESLVF